MVRVIADGGATKTEWRVIHADGQIFQGRTTGFNPFFQTEAQIRGILMAELPPLNFPAADEVHYYGAGCATSDKNDQVARALATAFPGAQLRVESDLLAAARAACGHRAGVAAILGTGANVCQFDGKQIVYQRPSLGFWLGDEGSGGYFGKRLVQEYLHENMPDELAARFEKRYRLDRHQLLSDLYGHARPGAFAASFSKFLFDHRHTAFGANLIVEGFGAFFDRYVARMPDAPRLPVHFVGSVAFYYSDFLRRVAADRGFALGNVLEMPIAGLTLYHQPPQ